jgi:hypothetical protein
MSEPPRRTGQEELRLAKDKLATAVAEFEAHSAPDGSDTDKAQRSAIVGAANDILAAVKNPTDQWMDVTAQTALMAANRLFWEWGAFDALPLDGSPVSYKDLAVKVDVEEKLLSKAFLFSVQHVACTVHVQPKATWLTVVCW